MSSLLRFTAVSERLGLSRSAVYARVRDGRFPQPISVGPRVVAWPENEVATWLDATIHGATEDELRELVKAIHAKRGHMEQDPERKAFYDRLTSTRMERRKERKGHARKEQEQEGLEGIALCAEAVSSQGGRTREYLIRRVLCTDLPAHLKLIVVSIANAANDKGFALTMQNRIAAQLGQSDGQITSNIGELQDRGILSVAQYGYQIHLGALPYPRRNQA